MGIDETQMIAPAPHQAARVEEPRFGYDSRSGERREGARKTSGRPGSSMKDHPEPGKSNSRSDQKGRKPGNSSGGDLRGEHAIKSGNLLKTGT
jgi:hypothetical protein